MPNTPSLVQEGVTVYSKGRNCTQNDGLLAEKIFEAVGPACYEVHESLIDASTGISGSGPAYMYIIIGNHLIFLILQFHGKLHVKFKCAWIKCTNFPSIKQKCQI